MNDGTDQCPENGWEDPGHTSVRGRGQELLNSLCGVPSNNTNHGWLLRLEKIMRFAMRKS